MPRNVNTGIYSPPAGTYGVTDSAISSVAYNAFVNDLGAEMTYSIDARGETPMAAALNMSSNKITNVANGSNPNDAVNFSQLNTLLPSGAVFAYAGGVVPNGYLLCDGTAYSRTTYASLFAAIGTVFGAGDGATTFNVPDMRARSPVGAGNTTDTAGYTTGFSLAQKYGEFFHTLTGAELTAHNHGVNDPGHTHGVSDPGHNHGLPQTPHSHVDSGHTHSYTSPGSGSTLSAGSGGGSVGSTTGTGFANIEATYANVSINPAVTGVGVVAAATNISIQSSGGSGAHNTIHPVLGVNFIIKT